MNVTTAVLSVIVAGLTITILAWAIDRTTGKHSIEALVTRLDRYAVAIDGWVNRIHLAGSRSKHVRWWVPEGHSWRLSVFTVAILAALVFGPTLSAICDPNAYWILSACVALLLFTTTLHSSDRFQAIRHWLVLIVGCATVWWWAGPHVLEYNDRIYRHVLMPWLLVLAAWAFFAWLLARLLLKRYVRELGRVTPVFELEPDQGPLGIDYVRLARSLLKAPFYHPLEILLWPAFAVLLIAHIDTMQLVSFCVAIGFWLVYAAAEMHEHLDHFMGTLRRAFFLGGQAAVSVLVIILAAGRIFEISYIKTLIEISPNKTNTTLLLYIAFAYLFFWFYEYWINRFLGERLLAALCGSAAEGSGSSRVACGYSYPGCAKQNGWLQIHGASRFALVSDDTKESAQRDDENAGAADREKNRETRGKILASYGRTALIEQLVEQRGNPGDSADRDPGSESGRFSKWGALITKWAATADTVSPQQKRLAIIHRMRFYFVALSLSFVATLAAVWVHYGDLPQKAAISIEPSAEVARDGPVDLISQLVESDRDRAILLAASGGGTRAALYAESVLHGIAKLGALEDVVLVSGVSGGSAALAYFAAHRSALKSAHAPKQTSADNSKVDCANSSNVAPAWCRFQEVMAKPYIQDVLDGVSEVRFLSGQQRPSPSGTRERFRLGHLLSESFARQMIPDDKEQTAHNSLGEVNDIGLIFNMAMTGRFEGSKCSDEVAAKDRPVSERERACQETAAASTNLAGGRLVLTNLNSDSTREFPRQGIAEAPDQYLNYEILNDTNIPLTTAAALSANFPPVFPDSAIDVGRVDRYWVTDGGASENRGVISLLYALKSAFAEIGRRNGCFTRRGHRTSCPTIHLVVAEASATELAFKQQRGFGALLSAKKKYANQVMVTLIEEMKKKYEELGGNLAVHYLYMPLVLRSNGGVGTHWMLPSELTITPPFGFDRGELEEVTIDRDTVLSLMHALHDGDGGGVSEVDEKAVEKIWEWICWHPQNEGNQVGAFSHRRQWEGLARSLAEDESPGSLYDCPDNR